MKKTHALGLASTVALTLTAPLAHAYVRTQTDKGIPLHWSNYCIDVLVQTTNLPSELDADTVVKATTASGAAWGRPRFTCTPVEITVSPSEETNQPASDDGVNRVVFRQDKWCHEPSDPSVPCFDKEALAITTVTAKADGTIIDADIEVNAVNFKWADLTVKGANGQDLQSVLTHEFGHFMGLAHNCGGPGDRPLDNLGKEIPICTDANSVVRAGIMFPSTIMTSPIKRGLSADETVAVCEIYGKKAGLTCKSVNSAPVDGGTAHDGGADSGAPVTSANEAGGCSFGGGTSGGAGLAVGLLAWIGFLGRRRRG